MEFSLSEEEILLLIKPCKNRSLPFETGHNYIIINGIKFVDFFKAEDYLMSIKRTDI